MNPPPLLKVPLSKSPSQGSLMLDQKHRPCVSGQHQQAAGRRLGQLHLLTQTISVPRVSSSLHSNWEVWADIF